MNYIMIGLAVILYIRYFQICSAQRKAVKSMLINSLAGVVLLILLSFITNLMGSGISITYSTVTLASVLGLPGVIMLTLLTFVI